MNEDLAQRQQQAGHATALCRGKAFASKAAARIALGLAWAVSLPALAEEKPKLPFYDWGACPFECCTYREWETTKPVVAREEPKANARKLFTLRAQQPVTGITGVVITTKPGVTRILKPLQLGYTKDDKGPMLSLKPGEKIYTLHYVGEANDLFWYQGNTYVDQCSVPEGAFGNVPFSAEVKVESRPKTRWWVKIKDQSGRIGWVEEQDNFAHMDACE